MDATLDALQTFAAAHGTPKRVIMRRLRSKEKSFKGSVFIEYASPAEAEAFLQAHAEGKVTFEGKPVEKAQAMRAYFDRKKAEVSGACI